MFNIINFIFLLLVSFSFAQEQPYLNLKVDQYCYETTQPFPFLTHSYDDIKREIFHIYIEDDSLLPAKKGNRIVTLIDDEDNKYIIETRTYNDFSYPIYESEYQPYVFDSQTIKLLQNKKNLKLVVQYDKTIKKKVEVPSYHAFNYITSTGEAEKQYKYVDQSVKAIAKFNVKFSDDTLEQLELCQNDMNNDAKTRLIYTVLLIIGILIALFIAYKTIKYFIYKTKSLASSTSERLHEYRVQKIAEDEAIRATVNKAVKDNDGELDQLQNLVNNAVAKGDTETAKALLEILEKQKQTKKEA